MKRIKSLIMPLLAAVALTLTSGCVNICFTRNPWSNEKVRSCYQSTTWGLMFTCAACCPTSFIDTHPSEFDPICIFTIPFIGLPSLADTVCEAAIDTVLLPFDWPISAYRKNHRRDGGTSARNVKHVRLLCVRPDAEDEADTNGKE